MLITTAPDHVLQRSIALLPLCVDHRCEIRILMRYTQHGQARYRKWCYGEPLAYILPQCRQLWREKLMR
jgi:hypothetical protein